MTRLIGIEVRRLAYRRLTRVGVLLAFVLIAVAAVIAAVSSKPNDPIRLAFMREVLPSLGFAFAMGGLIMGASSLGADWHAGTVMTQLTWEPRRPRVLAARFAACVVVVFALAVALQALLLGAFAVVASTVGTFDGTGGTWVSEVAGIVLRIGALASITGALGLSLTALTRNTAAAVGIVFAEMVVVEGLIRGLRPGWVPWLVGENAAVFLSGDPQGVLGSTVRTPTLSFLLLCGYAVALAALGLVAFVRRDVP